MWSEDIFMLVETGTSGHCHTYNPTTSSLADEGFYAMLGTSGQGCHEYSNNKL